MTRVLGADHSAADPLRILLVEDDQESRDMMLDLLGYCGHHVEGVGDGQEALEAVVRQPYDVVLLDLGLPVLDGFETARRILASRVLKQPPRLIALSGGDPVSDGAACVAIGMEAFVSKPVRIEDLDRMLRETPRPRTRPETAGQSSP